MTDETKLRVAKFVNRNTHRWRFGKGEWMLSLPAGQLTRFPGRGQPGYRGGNADRTYATPIAKLGWKAERYILDPDNHPDLRGRT